MTISGCTPGRQHGVGGNGEAAAVLAGSLTMTGCTVNGNDGIAYQYGGGMYIDPAAVTVPFSTFPATVAPLDARTCTTSTAM